MDCIEATCVQSSGYCSKPTAAAGPDHRSRSWQQRQHAHHRAHDLGIRPAPRSSGAAARPPRAARRQSRPLSGPQRAFRTRGGTPGLPPEIRIVPINAGPNNSTPALRRRRGTLRHITASLTQIRAPSLHPGTLRPERRYPLRTPFARTVRLITTPLCSLSQHRTTPPVALFAEWVAFTGIRSH